MDIKTGIASVNGAALYYEIAGSGPAVVLVHGMGLDCRMWDLQFMEFAERYQVIRYDLRGFGKSSIPGDVPYAHHTDLHGLLEFLHISSAHLIGLSMGGRVVMDTTLTYPEHALSLVLVDSIVHGFKFGTSATMPIIAQVAAEQGILAANNAWYHDPLFESAREKPEVAAKLHQIISEYSGWHWINKNPWTPITPPVIEQLETITTPTLVIVGERDAEDFQEVSNILSTKIPNSRKVDLQGVGHMSNMEDGEEFNRVVLEFIDTVRYKP